MLDVSQRDFLQPMGATIHTSHWTRNAARKIRALPENTLPAFDTFAIQPLMPGYDVWDSWFVMTEEGRVADVLGCRVLMALVKPLSDTPSPSYGGPTQHRERIAYFYSDDGVHYHVGGFLFETPLYSDINEWSGSTILRADGRIQTFYTIARGRQIDGIWQTEQRFATALQQVSREGADGILQIAVPDTHVLLIEPDGGLYETVEQANLREQMYPKRDKYGTGDAQVNNFCFRDPKFVKDPISRRNYLVFEANTGAAFCQAGRVKEAYLGGEIDKQEYAPTPDDLKSNGCVGVLELTNKEYTFGTFLHPWLTANLVTDEIERINVFWHQEHVYLCVVMHGNKCALVSENPDLQNRDYMLGFRASRLFGELTPLNGSGVVVQQKSYGEPYVGQSENKQYMYSWLLVPTEDKGLYDCISYAGYSTDAEGVTKAVKTAGPTVTVEIDGLHTRIVDKRLTILPAEPRAATDKASEQTRVANAS